MCKPLEQDSTLLNFLIQAKEIFTSWRDSGNAGLTKETFLACIQSIGAMIELTSYLHLSIGFSTFCLENLCPTRLRLDLDGIGRPVAATFSCQ